VAALAASTCCQDPPAQDALSGIVLVVSTGFDIVRELRARRMPAPSATFHSHRNILIATMPKTTAQAAMTSSGRAGGKWPCMAASIACTAAASGV